MDRHDMCQLLVGAGALRPHADTWIGRHCANRHCITGRRELCQLAEHAGHGEGHMQVHGWAALHQQALHQQKA